MCSPLVEVKGYKWYSCLVLTWIPYQLTGYIFDLMYLDFKELYIQIIILLKFITQTQLLQPKLKPSWSLWNHMQLNFLR